MVHHSAMDLHLVSRSPKILVTHQQHLFSLTKWELYYMVVCM